MNVSPGQFPGVLHTDGALPRAHDEPSTPTLVLDQLALLVLSAPLPVRPARHSADQLWINTDHLGVRGSLLCRLVSYIPP